jgi:hypothetical protein
MSCAVKVGKARGSFGSVRPNTIMDVNAASALSASMTHSEKLLFVVANGNAASFAYGRLEVHLEAARAQMGRIEAAIRESHFVGQKRQ